MVVKVTCPTTPHVEVNWGSKVFWVVTKLGAGFDGGYFRVTDAGRLHFVGKSQRGVGDRGTRKDKV